MQPEPAALFVNQQPLSLRSILSMERSWRLYLTWAIAVVTIWTLAFRVSRSPLHNSGREFPRSAVEALSTWDGIHYDHIANYGYGTTGHEIRFFNYFPLYPTIAGVIGTGKHAMLAGVLLSQLLTLASVLLMSAMVHGAKAAPLLREPGFWMIISPYGFFLFSFYTEATFLFLTLVHFAAFHKNRPKLSFAAGFLAGLTRPTALVLPVLLGVESLRRRRRNERWKVAMLCAAAPALGLGSYVIGYVGWKTGNIGGYIEMSRRYWPQSVAFPFIGYLRFFGSTIKKILLGAGIDWSVLIRSLSTTAVISVLIARRKRLDASLLAYSVAALTFVHSISPVRSTGRFELVLFPVFFAIAASSFPRSRAAWLGAAASAALWIKAFTDFAAWKWIA